MRKFAVVGLTVAAVALVALSATLAADDPKFTIKEVMTQAHDKSSGIANKVVAGTASKEEKDQLVELYTALGMNKPPKGSDASWKTKTDNLLKAAQAVAADEKGDKTLVNKLKSAANCQSCHQSHKGKS